VTGSGESDIVTDTSACGVKLSVSVAELLLGLGSDTPPGAVMVAVFDKVPVAEAEMVALTV
jgi:hypothetical protein